MAEPGVLGALLGGEFRILHLLGAGGMGSSYVAEQVSTGRQCTVKSMHMAEEDTVRRFLREPRLLMRIPSDHVAEVIRTGLNEDTAWFATELFDGESLDNRLHREGYLEPGEAFAILVQICSALDAAHRRGIVHCDIKPENVYLSRSGHGNRTAKVLGFDIAEWKQDSETDGTIRGTLLWMAPEQLLGEVSPATDVWALGLLAFEMLTGRSYWSPLAESLAMSLRKFTQGKLVRASVRAEQLNAPGPIPEGFDDWFSHCVAMNTSDRFPQANAALRALAPMVERGRARTVWSIAFPELSLGAFASVLERLQAVAGDAPLLLKRVVSGSVVFLLEGSRETYDVIRSLYEQNKLPTVLGVAVEDVQWRGEPELTNVECSVSPGRIDTKSVRATQGRDGAGLRAFISYSHVDDALCDELLIHLSAIRRQGIIRDWYDRRIVPGTNRHDAIHEALEGSQVFLPLVSANYLASDYCFDVEMRRAFEKHHKGEARVVPVIVRACDWEYPPLGSLQALPTDRRPVTSWSNRDEAWLDVTRGIKRAVETAPSK